mmetsp:Transcript_17996/g.29473  ORF Transcript_17996/g.29473 Transcript_17996/m.29473 type:complete len:413 (+) Transcript_17996:110-1348(+)|eukprot:scaffold6187_cov139-Skeletonema_menzelii.AAC.8
MVHYPKVTWLILLLLRRLDDASGFASCRSASLAKHHDTRLHSTTAPDNVSTKNPLGGVDSFEEWFTANSSSGAQVNNIKHALFSSNSLRGLEFTSTKSSDLSKVAVVPRKLVLSAPFSDEDEQVGGRSWDTNLSVKLWQECKKGKDSEYYGYCALLTRGANMEQKQRYPSTAPDALRHWTSAQKELLGKTENGKKLLNVEQKQQEEWKQKYANLNSSEKANMSFQDFQWAMEAVHSRAFRGDFGALDGGEGGPLRKVASLLLPLSALAFGIIYASDPSMNKFYIPLSIVAAAPVALTIIADSKGSKEAVMLPLIDSANHLQEADSVIEFDPSVDGFVLSLGRKCLVKEVDDGRERAQVCISYGVRKDSELLLNYGFLRGVTMDGIKSDDGDVDRSQIRQRLAEAFLERYSSD